MATKKRKKQRKQHVPSNKRRVQKKPISDRLIHSEYDITNEPLENPYLKHLPPQVSDTLEDLYKKALRRPQKAIPDLERLVVTYPEQSDNPREFVLYEQWRDQDALDAHIEHLYRLFGPPAPTGRLPAAFLDMCDETRGIRYDVVA